MITNLLASLVVSVVTNTEEIKSPFTPFFDNNMIYVGSSVITTDVCTAACWGNPNPNERHFIERVQEVHSITYQWGNDSNTLSAVVRTISERRFKRVKRETWEDVPE